MGKVRKWTKGFAKFEHLKYYRQLRLVNRDNKGTLNSGSGYGDPDKARYPRKARSLTVWKNFYKLFPYLAEADKFNGKTSSKMK